MRETSVSYFLHIYTPTGGQPVTQACALTGNQTCDRSVCGRTLNPLSHTDQWKPSPFKGRKQRLPPGPGGMPPVVSQLEIITGRDKDAADYLFKEKFLWEKCACYDPPKSHFIKRLTQDLHFNSSLCLLWRGSLVSTTKIFKGSSETLWWEGLGVQLCLQCQEETVTAMSHQKLLVRHCCHDLFTASLTGDLPLEIELSLKGF